MTWNDLAPEAEHDELDPAAVHVGNDTPTYDASEQGDPLARDLGRGFIDHTGTVRVWVDDDARLIRVRVTPRSRLHADGLAAATLEALSIAQARMVTQSWLPQVRIEPKPLTEPPSREALERRAARIFELAREMETHRPPRFVGGGGEGSGGRGRVRVVLDQLGNTSSVSFDETWLSTATPAGIASALLEAHQQAYAHYTPAELDATDYIRAEAELQQITYELHSMLSPQR